LGLFYQARYLWINKQGVANFFRSGLASLLFIFFPENQQAVLIGQSQWFFFQEESVAARLSRGNGCVSNP
jgi:hypothetical protein